LTKEDATTAGFGQYGTPNARWQGVRGTERNRRREQPGWE